MTIRKNGHIVAEGVKQNNDIFRMLFQVKSTQSREEINIAAVDLKTLHERMGHVNARTLRDMMKNDVVRGIKVNDSEDFFCESCQLGKSHRLSFNKTNEKRDLKPGELIHSDVCGPMSEPSIKGARFFVTFIDDASNYRSVYFMRHKIDVFEHFKEYERLVFNKFGRTIKVLRTDNGTEYCNQHMKKYLASKGIKMENSAPYTPEQNGKAERENRTIVESARTMLKAKDLPTYLWAEAVNTAVYVLNRTTSRKNLESTPYEAWNRKKPSLTYLRIFGSTAFANIPDIHRKKFDSKAKKVIFVGYQDDSTNYRLFDSTRKSVFISRNVTFQEKGQDSKEDKRHERNETDEEDIILPKSRNETEQVRDEEIQELTSDSEVSSDSETHVSPQVLRRQPSNSQYSLKDQKGLRG